jgi:hypothetical protein
MEPNDHDGQWAAVVMRLAKTAKAIAAFALADPFAAFPVAVVVAIRGLVCTLPRADISLSWFRRTRYLIGYRMFQRFVDTVEDLECRV